MLKAAETFFEWAVKRAAVMIAQAACDQHDRDVRRGVIEGEALDHVSRTEAAATAGASKLH